MEEKGMSKDDPLLRRTKILRNLVSIAEDLISIIARLLDLL